ncbi:MAG: hypothetical protein Q9183_001360, partial [Haloplaca sp. 2 TL-2023]
MALLISLLALLCSKAIATPTIGLPVNAQVPPVARTLKDFSFAFSASTFSSAVGPMTYVVANAPSWLQLDSTTRTFSGTPALEDAGSANFSLVASDSAGSTSMPVTLVISSSPGPRLGIPIEQQLSAYDGYQSPDTILLPRSSELSLTFSQHTFEPTSDDTVYYAICANNTPLPSWINFDRRTLSFSGTTPQITSPDELPQTLDIHFTASDVIGFSAAVASFRLVLENHLFVFEDHPKIVPVTSGSLFAYDGLRTSLLLDGELVDPADVQQIDADGPDWVSFDEATWVLSGVAPNSAAVENVSITATDRYDETATATVVIHVTSNSTVNLFHEPLGSVDATAGKDFSYTFNNSLAAISGTHISVDLGTATWLQFDQGQWELHGKVPSDLKPGAIPVNVTLTQGSASQAELLVINIANPSHSSSSRSTNVPGTGVNGGAKGARPTSTASSQSDNEADAVYARKSREVAAIAVPILVICLLAIMACCVARRRKRQAKQNWLSMTKRKISRPFLLDGASNEGSEKPMTEKPAATHKRESLHGLRNSVASKRRSLLRLSRNTTDDPSQPTKVDSWHEYIQELSRSKPRHALQPQFSLIAEEQRPSPKEGSRFSSKRRLSHTSKPSSLINGSLSRKYGQKKRRSDVDFAGSGLRLDRRMSGFGHGRNGSSFGTPYSTCTPIGIGHGNGGPPGFGVVKPSWRRQSVDSWTPTNSTIKTSDYSSNHLYEQEKSQKAVPTMRSFQHPPISGPLDHTSKTPTIHEIEDNHGAWRASIRAVDAQPPMTYGLSLHTFHKRRAHNRHYRNTFFSAGPSSRASSHMDWLSSTHAPILFPAPSMSSIDAGTSKARRNPLDHERIQRSYSQSSSLEPPASSHRFSSPRKPRSSPQKRTSGASGGNGGGLGSMISSALASRFHSSRSSFASTQRFGSAAERDNSGELGLAVGPMDLAEERDEEGARRWRHVDVHPNPLEAHTPPLWGSPNNVAGGGDDEEYGWRAHAAAMARQMQRLSALRQQH